MELRRRRLSVDGLLSSGGTAALADLERLLLFHIITTQPCDVFASCLEANGIRPAHNRCWDRFETVQFENPGE
jgi:hypothetical protein